MNILCCIGCCYCTKLGCYQDEDKVVYYVGSSASRVSPDFDNDAKRVGVNGSDDGVKF